MPPLLCSAKLPCFHQAPSHCPTYFSFQRTGCLESLSSIKDTRTAAAQQAAFQILHLDTEASVNSAGVPRVDTGEQRCEQPGSIYRPGKARFFIIKAINSAELATAKASSSHRGARHSLICSLKYLRGSLEHWQENSKRKSLILNEEDSEFKILNEAL